MLSTWTLMPFFWKVPSWAYFLDVGEILTLLAYSLATNFAESLLILCVPLLVTLLLPARWFREVFIARGAALSMASIGYLMVLALQFQTKDYYPTVSLRAWSLLLAAAAIALLVYLFGRIGVLRKIMEGIADRASIFAYILAPLSVISVLVVIARSLIR
jgi:hypothetical protein